MSPRKRTLGVRMNGLLENGYFKLFGLTLGLVAYVWQGATWKTSIESQFNMVSYQVAELDKRISTQIATLEQRVTVSEKSLDSSSGWRSSVAEAISGNAALLRALREELLTLHREADGRRR